MEASYNPLRVIGHILEQNICWWMHHLVSYLLKFWSIFRFKWIGSPVLWSCTCFWNWGRGRRLHLILSRCNILWLAVAWYLIIYCWFLIHFLRVICVAVASIFFPVWLKECNGFRQLLPKVRWNWQNQERTSSTGLRLVLFLFLWQPGRYLNTWADHNGVS